MQPRLYQKRHIKHNGPLASQPIQHHRLRNGPPDARVHDAVEPLALLVVVEHNISYRCPVQRPIWLQDPVGSKVSDNHVKAGCTWLDDFASEDVGVNDWYLMLGQQARYCRLACLIRLSSRRAGSAGEGKEKEKGLRH